MTGAICLADDLRTRISIIVHYKKGARQKSIHQFNMWHNRVSQEVHKKSSVISLSPQY